MPTVTRIPGLYQREARFSSHNFGIRGNAGELRHVVRIPPPEELNQEFHSTSTLIMRFDALSYTTYKGSAMSQTNRYVTKQDLEDAFTRFSQHILHEVGARFDETRTRLESIDTRLKLQAGLIQSGSRAMARFSEFSENSEQRWVDLASRVEALERKLDSPK
jgi:hypothetical protein